MMTYRPYGTLPPSTLPDQCGVCGDTLQNDSCYSCETIHWETMRAFEDGMPVPFTGRE